MATVKKATSKKNIDENQIMTYFIEYSLKNGNAPKNVFLFCQEYQIQETDFYTFFGSIEAVEKAIWVTFFSNATQTIKKDENFATYSDKDKLLTLYFTLFEIFTLNRSYLLFKLKEHKNALHNLYQLKDFRKEFKQFVTEIIEDNIERNERISKITKPFLVEGAWVQFLFILKFWLDDTSKGFEKTDIVIEKAVKAAYDVFDTAPIESVFDFGKFLWKEKFNK